MADSQLVTKNEVKKATVIGTTCISAYLVNYYLRHILSVLTPKMLETESFTVEHIALLSSTYMLFYAAGQLVNGFLGDFVSPKKMVFFGVFIAGLSTVSFPFMPFEFLQIVCFAVFGFALSMTRGPFMKIISENTRPSHARLICVFFSFAGFAGPVIASFIAMINNWKWVFIVAGGIAVVVAFVVYAVMSAMEAKNMLKYKIVKGNGISSLLSVFKIENFIFYMVIACLIEVSYSSISQWIPTLLIPDWVLIKTCQTVFIR